MKYPSSHDHLARYIDILDENKYPQLKTLPSVEYEKLFRLHVANMQNPVAFRCELKRTLERGIERLNTTLIKSIAEHQKEDKKAYLEIVKSPQRLSGYNECLWKLVKNGDIDKA